MVEHSVEREVLLVERRVLAVHMPDAIADAFCDCMTVHSHPEEMTWIEVCRQRRSKGDELLEGGNVVYRGSRVQFDADRQVGILGACEGREIAPVRRNNLGPLAVVDSLEIGEPTAGAEVGRVVCRIAARTSRHSDHPIGTQLRRQSNGLAQCSIVPLGELTIGMHGVAPGVECIETDVVTREQRQPVSAGLLTGQKVVDIAMRIGCVASGTNLDHRDVGSLGRQKLQRVLEAEVDERLEDHPDPQVFSCGHDQLPAAS